MASLIPASHTECYVFIDDSNLWIEGKKAHAKELVDANIDPRFRVDLGKFLHLVVTEGRHTTKAFLYGSVPPPNDSVWKAAKEKNYVVQTFLRSDKGREKEVDVAMARDITKNLSRLIYSENESTENVTFIIVTGDRDLKPPIDSVLEEGVPVELWSWADSMARAFRQLASTNPLFTAKILDGIKDRSGYTAFMSPQVKNDIDPAHAIVYKRVPQGKEFLHKLCHHLARLLRLFYITSIKKEGAGLTCDLIVQFPNSKPDVVLNQLRRLGNFEYQPCGYPQYTLQQKSQPIHSQSLTNRFEALSDIDEESLLDSHKSLQLDSAAPDHTFTQYDRDTNDEPDNWLTALYRKPGRLTRMQRQLETQCKWREHCAKASECPSFHTDYEKNMFRKYPKIQFKYWKAKDCNKKEQHVTEQQRRECAFAHTYEDSWCLACKMYGHLTNNCMFAKTPSQQHFPAH